MTAKTPYFHWGQATMFKALAHLQWVESLAAPARTAEPAQDQATMAAPGTVPGTVSGLPRFALITPARNEEQFLQETIEAVVRQSARPAKWIIVSDGSTDGTDEIVLRNASRHPWIELLRMPERVDRQFAGKALAFNCAYERLRNLPFDLIGNLDADITFEPDYFEFLIRQFQRDPMLGVAGTPFVEDPRNPGKHTYAHQFSQLEHVSGACQMFRRSCFDSIGGYKPVKGGAIDWIAVTTARMKGWKTQTFPDKVCLHHRAIGSGNNRTLMVRFHYGTKAYFVGSHPLWALIRGVFQMRQKPWFVGGLFFELGYLWACLKRTPRVVSPELMAFYRAEQMSRIRGIWPRIVGRA
jgi:cellulose synthase/poly-beta-1,6-N-acetylglucosamine synthase-like glycosyltransferase